MTQIRSVKTRPKERSSGTLHSICVPAPYRLDLTVNVLRRLSTNLVDVLSPDRAYLRVLGNTPDVAVVRVAQLDPGTLNVDIGDNRGEHSRLIAQVRRMLGVDADLTRFYQSASLVQWLHPLVRRMRGVRPPRYPTVWEACVNAIVFQQISLHAASAIMNRYIRGLSAPVEHDGVRLYHFPGAEQFLSVPESLLRSAGLSTGKQETLRRVAHALTAGVLNESQLEALPSPDAAVLLQGIKGIGPWTAAVILLRGLGRLDVFPENDTGVARSLRLVGAPSAASDVASLLDTLGADRGMLYYHLLLARLETRGALE
ncbi:MAG TPA: hypothetical protein VFH26_05205 [Gemmatimonadales bacterium]|nr:hypothetical protein [Gemmatimonadales bacterium]